MFFSITAMSWMLISCPEIGMYFFLHGFSVSEVLEVSKQNG